MISTSTLEQLYINALISNSAEDLYALSLGYYLNGDLSGAVALSQLCISLKHHESTAILGKSLIVLSWCLRASELKRPKYLRPLSIMLLKCKPIPWKELMEELYDQNLKEQILNYTCTIAILLKIVLIESQGFFPRSVHFDSVKNRLVKAF